MKTKPSKLAYLKKWRDENRQKMRRTNSEYYHKHKAEIREKRKLKLRAFYFKNKHRYKRNAIVWRIQNPEKKREIYLRNYNKRKAKLYEVFGKKCCLCGFDDVRALQLDHKNGMGRSHRKFRTGVQVYDDALKNPEEFQMLCANCNQIKRIENKEFSHGKVGKLE